MLRHFKFCFVGLNGQILAALYSKPPLKAAFIRVLCNLAYGLKNYLSDTKPSESIQNIISGSN